MLNIKNAWLLTDKKLETLIMYYILKVKSHKCEY